MGRFVDIRIGVKMLQIVMRYFNEIACQTFKKESSANVVSNASGDNA